MTRELWVVEYVGKRPGVYGVKTWRPLVHRVYSSMEEASLVAEQAAHDTETKYQVTRYIPAKEGE